MAFSLWCVAMLVLVLWGLMDEHSAQLNADLNTARNFLAYVEVFWLKYWVSFFVLVVLTGLSLAASVRLQVGLYDIAKKEVLTAADVALAQELRQQVQAHSLPNVLSLWCLVSLCLMAMGATSDFEPAKAMAQDMDANYRRLMLIVMMTVTWLTANLLDTLFLPVAVAEGALKDNFRTDTGGSYVYWAHEVFRRFDSQEIELTAKKVRGQAPDLVPQHPLFHEEPAPVPAMSDSLRKILAR
ncbi:hypothetical protein LC612_35325 [Nostoc sp. CHAB 5834]|nr:hypothetical protein [Nostoc sp. CHAB 5834]